MSFLIRDISFDTRASCRTNRKCRVPFLPPEMWIEVLFMNPNGARLFELPNIVCQRVRCSQTDKSMHMILNATHCLRNTIQSADGATNVFVQPAHPFRGDRALTPLCREHNMEVQTQKC